MLRQAAVLCITAACLLGGCSADRASVTHVVRVPSQVHNSIGPVLLDQQFATASLDDSQLGAVRGGFTLGTGTELRFAFQAATYVNRDLVQNVVLPMVTLTGGVGAVPVLSVNTGVTPTPAPTLSLPGQPAGLLAAGGNAPFGAIALGSGLAPNGVSIMSTSGIGGLTNFITNTLNGQLVQQATRVDITISGVNGLQQSSPVLDALRGAQILPR